MSAHQLSSIEEGSEKVKILKDSQYVRGTHPLLDEKGGTSQDRVNVRK
jgi:hypothetical protein